MSKTEEELIVCIDACDTRKSTSNTVEIRVITSRSNIPTHLLLNNIVTLDERNMYHLLYQTFKVANLCSILSFKIACEARRVSGPLYISFDVTLKPLSKLLKEGEQAEIGETCAICLEEERHLNVLPNCTHVFHDECIEQWLCMSNHCPLCRAVIVDDEMSYDDAYDSETSSDEETIRVFFIY